MFRLGPVCAPGSAGLFIAAADRQQGRNQRNDSGPESITRAMSIADEFRAKARKCFERARRAPDIDYQRLFRDLAVQWLVMAAEEDTRTSIDPPELPPSDEGRW
jgi:hypothetical protein